MNKIAKKLSIFTSKISPFQEQSTESELINLKLDLNNLKFIKKIQTRNHKVNDCRITVFGKTLGPIISKQ